jgi:5-methylcytosine-specific restriction endonuclease McrA
VKRSVFLRRRVPVGQAARRRRAAGGPRVKGRPALSREAWAARQAEVFAREGYQCRVPWCRASAVDVHHVVKRSQAGTDDAANLIALCRRCHDQADAPYRAGRLVIFRDPDGWLCFDVVRKPSKWSGPLRLEGTRLTQPSASRPTDGGAR